MARAFIIKKFKNREEPLERSDVSGFSVPGSRRDDFHINPSQVVDLTGMNLAKLHCVICTKFSSGKLYECRTNGHVVCEDCYTLMDPESGCIAGVGKLNNARCCSSFSSDPPSKALDGLMSTVKFRCLNNNCQELIGRGNDWKAHLEACPLLKEFMACPDILCEGSVIVKKELVSHCQEIHGIPLSRLNESGRAYLLLSRSKCDNGPKIAMTLSHEDRIIYVVCRNEERNCLRLAVFMVQGDVEWASRFRVELTTSHKQDTNMSLSFKINPVERDWSDLKIFGRSQVLFYAQLDDIFFNEGHNSKEELTYQFELKIKDVTEMCNDALGVSTWESLPDDMEVVDVEATNQDNQSKPDQSMEELQEDFESIELDDEDQVETRPVTLDEVEYCILEDDVAAQRDTNNIDFATRYPNIPNIRALRIFDDNE